jgi:hypothetical protein
MYEAIQISKSAVNIAYLHFKTASKNQTTGIKTSVIVSFWEGVWLFIKIF